MFILIVLMSFLIKPVLADVHYIETKLDLYTEYIDKAGHTVFNPKNIIKTKYHSGSGRLHRQDDNYRYFPKNKFEGSRLPNFKKSNLIAVKMNGKWGYADKYGNIIIKPQFDLAYPFSKGMAIVKLNNKLGYINESGKFIINPKFKRISPDCINKLLYTCDSWNFDNGYVIVADENNKFGTIDKAGNYIIKPQFDEMKHFSEGLAAVKLNGKWGYIDTTGEIVIKPQFNKAGQFFRGIAEVQRDFNYTLLVYFSPLIFIIGVCAFLILKRKR